MLIEDTEELLRRYSSDLCLCLEVRTLRKLNFLGVRLRDSCQIKYGEPLNETTETETRCNRPISQNLC